MMTTEDREIVVQMLMGVHQTLAAVLRLMTKDAEPEQPARKMPRVLGEPETQNDG